MLFPLETRPDSSNIIFSLRTCQLPLYFQWFILQFAEERSIKPPRRLGEIISTFFQDNAIHRVHRGETSLRCFFYTCEIHHDGILLEQKKLVRRHLSSFLTKATFKNDNCFSCLIGVKACERVFQQIKH